MSLTALALVLVGCGGPGPDRPGPGPASGTPTGTSVGLPAGTPSAGTPTTTDSGDCGSVAPCGSFDWALQFQSTDNDRLSDVGVLSDGGIVVVGEHARALTLGVGRPDATVLDEGCGNVSWEGLIAVYNPDATLRWVQQITGCTDIWVDALEIGEDDAILIGGRMLGAATLGGGQPNERTIDAGRGAYFAKYAADGTFLWANTALTELTNTPSVNDGAVDAAGNSYFTGRFQNRMTVDPDGPSPVVLASPGNWDRWVVALDPGGALLWARQDGHPDISDDGKGIAALTGGLMWVPFGSGGVVTVGYGEPGEVVLTTESGRTGPLARLSAATGALEWATMEGGSSSRGLTSLGDDVLTCGGTTLSGIFGQGQPFETTLPANSHYLARYGSDGTLRWASGPLNGSSSGHSAASGADVAAVAGSIVLGPVPFSECGPSFDRDGPLDYGAFVATYDVDDGSFLCAWDWGGPDMDEPNGVAVAPDGSVYVVGEFEGTTSFARGTSDEQTLVAVSSDGFLVRFTPPPAP